MKQIYIVIQGGCVSYVSSEALDVKVDVIDLDDYHCLSDPAEIIEMEAKLDKAELLLKVW